MTTATTQRVTWQTLVELEPRLAVLLAEAEAVRPRGKTFCGNAVWFGWGSRLSFKRRVSAMVGWDRQDGHPVLSSCRAYDVAYQTIYDALPNCRGRCGCL